MDLEKFESIMSQKCNISQMNKDMHCITKGLLIIHKYLPGQGIDAAEHDIVYSVNVDEILEAGITEEDSIELKNTGWMISDDHLAHFV